MRQKAACKKVCWRVRPSVRRGGYCLSWRYIQIMIWKDVCMCEKKRGEGGISEGGFSNDACLWMWMAQVSVSIHASECESERVRFRRMSV